MSNTALEFAKSQLAMIHKQATMIHQQWGDVIAELQGRLPEDQIPQHSFMHLTSFLEDVGELRIAVSKAVRDSE
jgi:hypothetical protein